MAALNISQCLGNSRLTNHNSKLAAHKLLQSMHVQGAMQTLLSTCCAQLDVQRHGERACELPWRHTAAAWRAAGSRASACGCCPGSCCRRRLPRGRPCAPSGPAPRAARPTPPCQTGPPSAPCLGRKILHNGDTWRLKANQAALNGTKESVAFAGLAMALLYAKEIFGPLAMQATFGTFHQNA